MGNTESNVTSGVKKQAGTCTQLIYKFVDVKGKFNETTSIFKIVETEINILDFMNFKHEIGNGDSQTFPNKKHKNSIQLREDATVWKFPLPIVNVIL